MLTSRAGFRVTNSQRETKAQGGQECKGIVKNGNSGHNETVRATPVNRNPLSWPILGIVAAVAVFAAGAGSGVALVMNSRHGQAPAANSGQATAPVTGTTTVPPVTGTAATTHQSVPPGTRVVTYQPWDGSSLAPGFHESVSATGFCWMPSMATNRPDAFRCMSGNSINDPCFASLGNQDLVACPYDGPFSVEVLRLSKPLPPPHPPGATSPYWLLTLSDGETCEAFTGLGDLNNGMMLSYQCGDGEIGGSPNYATPYWTVYYQPSESQILTTKTVLVAYR